MTVSGTVSAGVSAGMVGAAIGCIVLRADGSRRLARAVLDPLA